MTGKVIASCFALAAFAVAVVAGMAGDNSASHVLSRALIAMILCYPVGLLVGIVCERVIAERVDEHVRDHPLPTPSEDNVGERVDPAPTADEKEVITT